MIKPSNECNKASKKHHITIREMLRSWLLAFLSVSGAMLLSPAAFAATDGAQLYAQNCAACHGADGRGGVGVPLALPSFLSSVDDHYLDTTIRLGRPGRVMPAFAQLDREQRLSIIRHLRSWAGDDLAVRTTEKPAPLRGNPLHGKQLYTQHCMVCHGEQGEGGFGTGVTFSRPRDMPIIAPALNNPGFLAAASDEMIRTTLMHGREGTPMVSFLDQGLSVQDIDDVVSYIRRFEDTPGWRPGNDDQPVLEVESSYSMEETVAAVMQAAEGKNFRIIREQWLEDGLFADEVMRKEANIVYFCNFDFINEALALDPRVGLFMPCRITVVEQAGKVKMMSINPKYMSRLFNNAELDEPCNQMYHVYMEIMEEASL